jgi:hypothetical protein
VYTFISSLIAFEINCQARPVKSPAPCNCSIPRRSDAGAWPVGLIAITLNQGFGGFYAVCVVCFDGLTFTVTFLDHRRFLPV